MERSHDIYWYTIKQDNVWGKNKVKDKLSNNKKDFALVNKKCGNISLS